MDFLMVYRICICEIRWEINRKLSLCDKFCVNVVEFQWQIFFFLIQKHYKTINTITIRQGYTFLNLLSKSMKWRHLLHAKKFTHFPAVFSVRSKIVAASYFQKILCIQGVKTLEHYPCSYFFQKIFVSMLNHLLSKVLNSKYFHVYKHQVFKTF